MRGAIDGSFQREVAAARKVAPFCTAQIVEVGPDFIVTEYIDGPSLREVIERSGPLTGPSLYRLAVGTATALAAIHQAGVVHRDFKPGNVLLGPDGPRVIDFGIARQLDATLSATSAVLGTPSYMAPEQVSGQRVMPAADVFAWASTLTFAATGQPPFGQDTVPAIMHRILNAAPDLGLVDRPLHELLTACLAKDPARRPDMQQVLTRLLGHTTMPLSDVLSEGRTVALTPEAALADARTLRWTTLRLSPLARPRRVSGPVVLGAVAGVAATAVLAVGLLRFLPTTEPGAVPTPSTQSPLVAVDVPGVPKTGPEFAAAVEKAIANAQTASVTVEGTAGQGQDGVDAKGKLHHVPGKTTNYDLMVSNPNDPSGEIGSLDDMATPRRVVLVDDLAYDSALRQRAPAPAAPSNFDEAGGHIWLAMTAGMAASPRHLQFLLKHSRSVSQDSDRKTITLRGQLKAKAPLADAGLRPLYEIYSGGTTADIKFVLLLTSEYLPKSFEVNMIVELAPGEPVRSPLTMTYKSWGTTGTIAAPY
ncbi:hypothetical protein GCM10009550_24590 [Actinocorallia libanotica]|uniref:non-specific serine/threonine protein kinase n=2 Tax=Actinocorallia libanotica TaxID=46162 RepID=A0ABP4BB02_9ACTN